jgi:hypothetical protein
MNEIIDSPFPDDGKRKRNALTETAGARQDQSRELADLQVMHLMAQQFPRDPVAALDRMLHAFARIDLAVRAQYQYARGGTDIRGPSIQAMQAIALEWQNIDAMWRERSRGIDARGIPFSEVEAMAVDLQSRTRKRIAFIVPHWRDTKQGGYVLKDERDIYELCANQAQRRVRACLEAVIPADVIGKVMELVDNTLLQKADTRPEAMAKMVEAFAPFGVTRPMIEKRIQRSLDAITPKLVVDLKRIYASLRDDMSTASDWFEGVAPAEGEAPAEDAGASRTTALKSNLKGGKAKKDAAPPPAADGKAAGKDGPAVTYAEVAAGLTGARTRDELETAADLIRYIVDAKQRAELEQLYSTTAANLDDAGDAP